jgi:two-component system KDP operon response regulator KdpE
MPNDRPARIPASAARQVRVLSVVGDQALANTVDLTLRHGSYVRRSAGTVMAARESVTEWKPHLLVLDIDLEAGAAMQLIDDARAGGTTAIIALTRRSDLRGKLDAFERGADDYIGVPFDVLNRKVLAGDHELHLTSLEQALLYLLAANAGSILTREQIVNALWGTEFVLESNVVDRHVRALRAKLQDDWQKPRYIETVSGTGYRFLAEQAAGADGPA